MDASFVYLIVLVVFILFSAFFSGSEAALFSLTRSQIDGLRKESAAGREIARCLRRPRRLLITILIGNLIVNVFSTSAATSVAIEAFGGKGVWIAFAVMSGIIMVFGEIVPKVLAINRPKGFSLSIVYPLKLFHVLLAPFRWPMARFSDWVIDFLKKRLGVANRHFSKDELLTALGIGRDEGHLGDFEYDLLTNVIDFRETTVKEIMTPSINVVSLPASLSHEGLRERMLESGFSRVPVHGETTDDIKGILHIKDLARVTKEDPDFDITAILMPPFYVPESSRISFLFHELGNRRAHFAVVIDEYGSFAGIVTVEDILEELVGEIRDSKEPQTASYTMLRDGRIVVLGTMEIEDFNEIFGADIVDDAHATIAGHVIGAIGKIPRAGETFEIGDLRFHVISAQPNRIRKMRVEKV